MCPFLFLKFGSIEMARAWHPQPTRTNLACRIGNAAIHNALHNDRWLGVEPDPHDLLITYPSEPMTMWPISTRVNKPENDDPSILDRAVEPVDWQAPLLITSEA
jgi:hypothetical protein